MKTVLIVGATRNLGKALVSHYAAEPDTTVYATARYGKPTHHSSKIHWISGIDITRENAGQTIVLHYNHDFPIDIVYVVATGSHDLFAQETLQKLDYNKQLTMYKTSAIGPLFLVQHLVKSNCLAARAKIILIGSAAGSISLRTQGGNHGFGASQAALNMVARLLSFDLKPQNISVGVMFPGRIHLEHEERHAGSSDAVRPEVAVKRLADFVEKEFNMENSGQLWAPGGFK